MARLFISYSRQDSELVVRLRQLLTDMGHEVLTDSTVVSPGQPWQNALDEALTRAEVLVSIISPTSQNSQFVMTELGAALAYARESDRMLVLPVVVHNADIPPPIQNIHAIVEPDGDVAKIADRLEIAIADFVGRRLARQHEKHETQQKIEQNSAVYVEEAIASQQTVERRYRRMGEAWFVAGIVALLAGLAFVALELSHISARRSDWSAFAYVALRSIIVVGLLGACAKYAFTLGRSFTIESLKCADRLHAIAFGRFYLRIYGANANWQEVKEAFANWNIDRPSSFADSKASDFDPKIIELITGLMKHGLPER